MKPLLLLLFCGHSLAYDMSEDMIARAPDRSWYYTAEGRTPQKAFLADARRDDPVVVHVHGCAGFSVIDDLPLVDLVRNNGANVVAMDFHARHDAKTSCPSFKAETDGHPETRNPQRITARRAELERQVAWLREHGFGRIWVTGHSEGGRTVQGLKAIVQGVLIFGMDCKNMEFWEPNPLNNIHVFLSRKDPWLSWPKYAVRACGSLWDRNVTHHWTQIPGHSPLLDESWKDLVLSIVKRR